MGPGLRLGPGVTLGADLSASYLNTDNYFSSSESTTGANGYSLRPRAELRYDAGTTAAAWTSDLNYLKWDVPGALGNVVDYGSRVELNTRPLLRHFFSLTGGYRMGHDDAGSVRTEGVLATDRLDRWRDTKGGINYRFGGIGARANVELSYSKQERQYTTNRSLTQLLDYTQDAAGYVLFYNYSPKTSWLLSTDRINTRYALTPTGFASRDAVEYRILTGLRWVATAKTQGDVRVGYFSREPSDHGPADNGLDWKAAVQWQPLSATRIALETGRSSATSYRQDTLFNQNRTFGASWQQTLNARLTASLAYNFVSSRFRGSSGLVDTYQNVSLRSDYSFSPRLSVFGGVGFASKSSNQANRDYDALRGDIGFRLGL